MNKQEAIKEWKKLGIVNAEFEFSCGGDSMNDTTLNFYNEKNKVVQSSNLESYIDDEVYKNVTFYEASDGHYQGESGIVYISLDEDSDNEEEHDFTYSKESQAEYSETFTEIGLLELTDEQITFIQKNVSNINGGEGDRTTLNYKRDFIMTDDDERIMNDLNDLIDDFACNYHFENAEGESNEWYSYTTNDDDELDELTIEGSYLKLVIRKSYTIYQESSW